MPQNTPLLTRFLAKIVLDILPAALASVVGGLLLTHYQLGRFAAPAPAVEQSAAASAEMMKLVRDEHALIVDFLNAEVAAEKQRLIAGEITTSQANASARSLSPAAAPRHVAVATVAAKPVVPHEPAVAAAASAPAAPVVITPAPPIGAEPAHDPDSLLAKTAKVKDNVLSATLGATWRVAMTIGGIPSSIASFGDRIGAPTTNSSSTDRLASATW